MMTSHGSLSLATGSIPMCVQERTESGEVECVAELKTKFPPQRGDILHLQPKSDEFRELEIINVVHSYEVHGDEVHYRIDVIAIDTRLMALLCAETGNGVH